MASEVGGKPGEGSGVKSFQEGVVSYSVCFWQVRYDEKESGPWIWQCGVISDLDEQFRGPGGVKNLLGVGAREERRRIRKLR